MVPARSNPWPVLVYCCLMQGFVIGISFYGFSLLIVPWTEAFSASRSDLLLALTTTSVAAAILAPLAGWLIDRKPSKQLMLIGQAFFALALLLMSLATKAWHIVAVYTLIVPIASVFSGPLIAYAVAAKRAHQNTGLAMGVIALGTSVGGFVAPPAIGALLADYSWQHVLQGFAVAVPVLLMLPGLFVLDADPITPSPQQAPDSQATQMPISVLPIAAFVFCGMVPSFMFMAVIHNMGALAMDIGVSLQQAAWAISLASIAMAAGKLIGGYLSDRIGIVAQYFLILSMLGLGMAMVIFASTFVLLVSAACLIAAFTGGVAPLMAGLVKTRWRPDLFGRVMGIHTAFAGLSAVGSYLTAVVRDTTGSYSIAFAVLASLLVVAAFVFTWFLRRQPALQ